MAILKKTIEKENNKNTQKSKLKFKAYNLRISMIIRIRIDFLNKTQHWHSLQKILHGANINSINKSCIKIKILSYIYSTFQHMELNSNTKFSSYTNKRIKRNIT